MTKPKETIFIQIVRLLQGGDYSTKQLMEMFNCSEITVRRARSRAGKSKETNVSYSSVSRNARYDELERQEYSPFIMAHKLMDKRVVLRNLS